MPIRNASAVWEGNLAEGKGVFEAGSGLFKGAYNAGSRFAEEKGTNPEELIGAANAACFSMALSAGLAKAGFKPKRVATTAKVHINKVGDGFTITKIELSTEAEIPGIDETEFQKHANDAKSGCPVSRALAGPEIFLTAKLKS